VAYLLTLRALLGLQRDSFHPAKVKIEDFIAMNAMGERNTIHQLQNYVVGIAPGGLMLDAQGALDLNRSFERRDYFSLLHNISVRNNVQPQVSNKPIDIIAMRIPSPLIAERVSESDLLPDSVWVYGGADRQALILARRDSREQLSFRYQPIKNLRQSESGEVTFEAAEWQPGFPFRVFEDEKLGIPSDDRGKWLNGWHMDSEWLHALHKTKYSNGVIGVYEAMALHPLESLSTSELRLSHHEKLLRRFATRQRNLVEPDLQLVANNHWNFDVRGFNPGGNHGSFFRISTHSTLMFSGGNKTGISRATVIAEPYDGLSFVPTVLALTGQLGDDNRPVLQLQEKGFRRFPAPPIKEVLPNSRR
jgi:hypothetical protein